MNKHILLLFRAVLALLIASSITLNVFASTETMGTVDVETTAGAKEQIDVTITIEETTNADGSVSTESESSATDFVTENGMTVDVSASSQTTTDASGTTTGSSYMEYTSTKGNYSAEGGYETVLEEAPLEVTVQIPLDPTDDPETEENEARSDVLGDAAGTITTGGDVPSSPSDGSYDYTSEKIVVQGSVSVETSGASFSQTMDTTGEGLDYLHSETDVTADNDLFLGSSTGPDIPESPEDIPDVAEGYQFVYIGAENNSQFWSTHLYTTPDPDYPEEPLFTDENGVSYYLRQSHNVNSRYNVEGLYVDGEMAADTSQAFPAVYNSVMHFLLIDTRSGELITTYCADISTPAEKGFSYNIQNLEQATYYTDEQAAMIRTVALNGYWGVLDDNTTAEPEPGSLAAVHALMRDAVDENGEHIFTQADIDAMTDGAAMTATQFAIWRYSNAMSDLEFVNCHYIAKDANNVNSSTYKTLGDIPASERASVDVIFKFYDYLTSLPGTGSIVSDTSNTVITAENMLEDMSVTVIKKAEDHENNKDADKDNDAYVADLTFTLVVAPCEGNGDDLMVYVLDKDGNELASGRIAGTLQEGETMLTSTGDRSYTFEDIVLTEGEQNFHITLKGVQNLDKGVYLYSSEMIDGTSSQTMVGIAEGQHSVSVSLNITFEFDQQEQVVAREHVWRSEKTVKPPVNNDPIPPVDPDDIPPAGGDGIPEDPAGPTSPTEPALVEIPEQEVPLAAPPRTGDPNGKWMTMFYLSGISLAAFLLVIRMKTCI